MTITANPQSPYRETQIYEQFTEVNLTVSFYSETSTGGDGSGEPAEPPTQTPVTVASAVPEHKGISVSILNNTITITGKFAGVFDTPISFKTTAGEYKTVKAFSELPTAYDFIYRYVAPMNDEEVSKITVTFDDDSTYDYEVVVHYDRLRIANESIRHFIPDPSDPSKMIKNPTSVITNGHF